MRIHFPVLLALSLLLPCACLAEPESKAAGLQNKQAADFGSHESQTPIELSSIIGKTVEIRVYPDDIQMRGRHGLKVLVKNKSDRALIFYGDLSIAKANGKEYKCAELDEFEDLSGSQPNFISRLNRDAGETVAAAVTVGSWQTVSDILKSKNKDLKRFGKDEERRRLSESEFGQRILWPGDESEGTILFAAREPLQAAVLEMPVRCFFNARDKATAVSSPQQ